MRDKDFIYPFTGRGRVDLSGIGGASKMKRLLALALVTLLYPALWVLDRWQKSRWYAMKHPCNGIEGMKP